MRAWLRLPGVRSRVRQRPDGGRRFTVRRVTGWTHRQLAIAVTIVAAGSTTPRASVAQDARALLQLEVGDSIGLPLPDAALEVYTIPEGAIGWEWVPVEASGLPEGMHLIRLSFPGYRASAFSVPLRTGSIVSLRVRLSPMGDTAAPSGAPRAEEVRARGLAIQGRVRTDIIGTRRVMSRDAIERSQAATIGALLRQAKGTELNVVPAPGGTFRPYTESQRGGTRCPAPVVVNADRRRILAFETADRLYAPGDVEVIEIFPRGSAVPFAYQAPRSTCGVIVLWLRNS